jgi:hypothetical protein
LTVLKGVDRVQRGTLKLHADRGQFLGSRTVNLASTPAHRDASLTLPVGRVQGKNFPAWRAALANFLGGFAGPSARHLSFGVS